ncbi:MAG: hypothetical protein HY297_05945 [Thaumarchaeota archaeon]|nr:hypothetical protein [Nitrososphaerota archaeon]
MNSKLALLAITLLLAYQPFQSASATDGTYLSPSQVQTHGPLVDRVVISVYTSESGMQAAVASGTIQAPEWTFSTGAYTTLASDPHVIVNNSVSYSWFGIVFNSLKFPGNNVHFRRAIQYLQDYDYIQSTILNGFEGTASPDVLPCGAYAAACNPVGGGNASVRNYAHNFTMATAELLAAGLFCDGCTAGTANSTTNWFTDANHTVPFAPNLWRRSTHHRNLWGARTSYEAQQIGVQFSNHLLGQAVSGCPFSLNSREIVSPGVFNPGTYENSPQVINATVVAIDNCDMYTFGFIADLAFNTNMQEYNSQFSGTTTNTGNYENQSINVATNHVLYATTMDEANRWARNFAVYYSQQLPTVMGYFENVLFANNANGWTGFAQLPTQSPNDFTGLYYTLLNVHKCGPATCTLGATNGGTPGGTFNLALEQVTDEGGLNPLYPARWAAWQSDVWASIIDPPMLTPPDQTNVFNAFLDHMTTSHSISAFNGMTPSGRSAFNYQVAKGPALHSAQKIVKGQRIELTFARNITFNDGVPLTTRDYQFSLDAWDLAGSPNYPDRSPPFYGAMAGPYGLIASYLLSKYTMYVYINSSSVWNLPDILVPVLPLHLWKYFNLDHVATDSSTVDTSRPFAFASAYSIDNAPRAPRWVFYLNNLEVGAGPFWLKSWDTPSGTGEIDRNVFYFRSAWDANVSANSVPVGTAYHFVTTLSLPIFNPTSTSYCGVATGTTRMCQLKGTLPGMSWAKMGKALSVFTSGGVLVKRYNLAKNVVTGVYSAAIDTSSLAPGNYRLVIWTTYTLQGLIRTWYQATGFNVHA